MPYNPFKSKESYLRYCEYRKRERERKELERKRRLSKEENSDL